MLRGVGPRRQPAHVAIGQRGQEALATTRAVVAVDLAATVVAISIAVAVAFTTIFVATVISEVELW